MEESIHYLKKILEEASHPVFFGGAGVSTDSGIPDFRGPDGVYTKPSADPSPEYCLSHRCLVRNPERFYAYFREHMLFEGAEPNEAHFVLAKWEKEGRLAAVITQNIDGLHTASGSRRVLEVHGSSRRWYCETCRKGYTDNVLKKSTGVPLCSCGGRIRPDVVLYDEPLPEDVWDEAVREIRESDLIIVAGTSLTVYPAAGLLRYFRGKHRILINLTPTPYDDWAEVIFRGKVSDVLSAVDKAD